MLTTVQELEQAALTIRKQLLKLCTMQTIHIGCTGLIKTVPELPG